MGSTSPCSSNDLYWGGRLRTRPPDQSPAPAQELGATSFPAESRLLWHYVRAWAAYKCQRIPVNPDEIRAPVYPDPGVVPSVGCYQDTWFRLTADLQTLPGAMREAADLWISFLAGLNDGIAEPQTKYLADIQNVARRADLGDDFSLFLFWKNMRGRYEHKSLGEVLQTEVFASRGKDVPSLMHAFGSVGLGTGGFGALFEVGFLEVLRNVVWNTSGRYMLPDRTEYPSLYPEAVYGTAAFVDGLAHLAHDSGDRSRAFGDMFRTSTTVTAVSVRQVDGPHDKVVVVYNGTSGEFDLAIVATSSRAMQEIGLSQDAPNGPFTRIQRHTEVSIRAVEGIQAAIHQLNMVSASRSVFEVGNPANIPEWPKIANGTPVSCFVTDRYAQVTSFAPLDHSFPHTQAVGTALGNEALKFQTSPTGDDINALVASSFDPPDSHDNLVTIVGRTLRQGWVTGIDWNTVSGIGGGFKLDRPGGTYLTGCLFYQPMLAGLETERDIRPYSRVFLAGDSVGFLGGWAEGAAMSALNAVTAVLVQCEKASGQKRTIRSRALVTDNEYSGFNLTSIGLLQPDLPRLKGSTWLPDCSQDQRKPGSWRYEGGVEYPLIMVGVSEDGGQMIGKTAAPFGIAHRIINPNDPRDWSQWAVVPNQVGNFDQLADIAITCDAPVGRPGAGPAQVVILATGDLWHTMRLNNDQWDPWNTVSTPTSPLVKGTRCDIAAVRGSGVAFIALIGITNVPAFGIRNADRTWQDFQLIPGGRHATDIAVAASGLPHDDNVVFGWVEDFGEAVLAMRRPDGTWTNRQELPLPADAEGGPATITRISLVCDAPGTGRITALCTDGNTYQRRFDVTNVDVGLWRRAPFPLGVPYKIDDIALGGSFDWRDPTGSATVWSVSSLPVVDDGAAAEAHRYRFATEVAEG